MHWAEKIKYQEVDRTTATHLVVGSGPAADDPESWVYGVVAAANDEFTAHRIAKEINQDVGASVLVMENDSDALHHVHHMVNEFDHKANK